MLQECEECGFVAHHGRKVGVCPCCGLATHWLPVDVTGGEEQEMRAAWTQMGMSAADRPIPPPGLTP